MGEFPANSKMPHTPQGPPKTPPPAGNEKRVKEAVVEGVIVHKPKKSLGRKFSELFFSGETPKSVAANVATGVLIPAVRDMLFTAGRDALQRVLYPGGNSNAGSAWRPGGGAPVVAYNRYAQPSTPQPDQRATMSHQGRTTGNYEELLFPSRMHAEQVVDEMLLLLQKFQTVTVGDFFDLAGVTTEFPDRSHGWRTLQGVVPIPRDGGFILNLPRPERL